MKSFLNVLLLIFCFFLSTTTLVAQLDNNNDSKEKGKIKAIILNNSKEATKPKALDLDGSDGFKKVYDEENKKLKEKQKKSDLKNKGILTQEKINEQNFLKSFKKINGQYSIPKIDQDLGSFRTDSKSVNIICRDFQYPDGDRITIFVNDIPVIHNIELKSSYQKFNIPLEIGINKIAFTALNQGSSGPNTAAFKVFNDTGTLISSNEWNLATDAKATIVIAKDK
ncbi:hypothetical protein SAMN05216503_0896 [Polaribacter sp. KT25b]|uniref:hypothetical protein n=1 Tax=Polaribacter sp. KT25b TaxID=1855336 RepID=UPI00087BBBC7|nr:hypothetical protein [Polaribacter sp. KT25b]SDR78538.1 hypothetical protein SAMN05216503_0896 [Polaribacter sp. KT25b]